VSPRVAAHLARRVGRCASPATRVCRGGRARSAGLSIRRRAITVGSDSPRDGIERVSPGSGAIRLTVADTAVEYGWVREGAPTTPVAFPERRRRNGGWLSGLLGGRPRATDETIVSEPILRRLSDHEQAMIGAADLFNASQYRRTVGGIGRSLGTPNVSVVVLSGVNSEVVVTVAWEISWYQYRVEAEHGGHVRLEDRGDDPGVIDQRWRDWNAQVADDGQLTLV